jgi:uncharacterized Zn finger protein
VKRRSTARGFATTWWGKVWITALEDRARLDPNRLPRGRTYARHDHVTDLVLHAGEVTAQVQGSRATPYRVRVRLRTFNAAEWATVFKAIAARAAHAAALLDGELDPGVIDEAADAGVDLLPGPGELQPRCSCPDWADPCKHSAAVCYLVARALDADPFGLFLLRGLDRAAVLSGVRQQRADGAVSAPAGRQSLLRPADRGVPAGAALRRTPGPRPARPGPPSRPGAPAPLPVSPVGISRTDALDAIAREAIDRAWRARTEGSSTWTQLNVEHDLARYADTLLDRGGIDDLARRSGRTSRQLVRLALAWRHGQVMGVDLVTGADRPVGGPDSLAEVQAAASELDGRPGPAVQRGGWIQLGADTRLGQARDGRWYRLDRVGRTWELRQSPADDPADLL